MIAIIDYGVGNLRSVQKAFEFVGYEAIITEEKKVLERADKIVLPGVGAFASGINSIKKMGLDKVIIDEINKGKYFMGICLGMQMVFSKSYEYGENEGLNIIKGEIKLLPDNVKKPHIGWNNLNIKKDSVLFKNIGENPYVYFVHSYYLETKEDVVTATTEYGKEIQVAVERENVFALQFHPEKSGDVGLKILKNFGGLWDEDLSSNRHYWKKGC